MILNPCTSAEIIAAARLHIGVTKVVHQAPQSDVDAVDCVGLLIVVARGVLGFDQRIQQNYSRRPNWVDFCAGLDRYLEPVSGNWPDLVRPGRVVGCCGMGWCHCAIVDTDPSIIIHANPRHPVVTEHTVTQEWTHLIRRVWRFPRVTDDG